MAFVDLGSLGATGSTANNQATLALTTAAAVAAGELVVIVVADDNRLATADADGSEVSGVTDSGGNTWAKGAGFANNNAATQAGAAVQLWYTHAKAPIANGGTITATFTNGTLSDATGMTARHFSVGGQPFVEGTPGTLANDAADPGSLNVTTANIHCVRIRGIASEVGNNTNLTASSGWTAWANGNSTATGTSAEMCARAEHLISVATSAASDPTYVNADCASVYVAFRDDPVTLNPMEAISVGLPPTGPRSYLGYAGFVNQIAERAPPAPPVEDLPCITEYYNPWGVGRPVWSWESPLNLALNEQPPAAPPFFQTDWVNPCGALRAPVRLEHHNLLLTAGDPFNQTDWPNPGKAQPGYGFEQRNPNLVPAPIVGDPFYQTDWPNPRSVQIVYGFVQRNQNLTPVAADLPCSVTAWPVPPAVKITFGFEQRNQNLTPVVVAGDPFYKTDWPNPLPIRFWDRTWVWQGNALTYIEYVLRQSLTFRNWKPSSWVAITSGGHSNYPLRPPVVLPNPEMRQRDWPNPRGPIHPHVGLVQRSQHLVEVVVPVPFFAAPWDNPTGPAPNQRGMSFWSALYAQAMVRTPFVYDWPNPRQVARSADLLTWTQQPQTVAAVVTPPPPANYDWPVPAGPIQSADIRNWILAANLALAEPPAPPIVIVAADETKTYYGRWPKDFLYDRPYLSEFAEALKKAVQKKEPEKAKRLARKIVDVTSEIKLFDFAEDAPPPQVTGVIELASKLEHLDRLQAQTSLNLARALEIRVKHLEQIIQDEEDAEILLMG